MTTCGQTHQNDADFRLLGMTIKLKAFLRSAFTERSLNYQCMKCMRWTEFCRKECRPISLSELRRQVAMAHRPTCVALMHIMYYIYRKWS